MAVTCTNLSTSGSVADATSYATASVSPTAGKIVAIGVVSSRGALPAIPTISGASTTWTQGETLNINSFVRLTTFYGVAAGTGALTIDFGGETQERCRWSIVELTNTKASVATAIVQDVGASASSASSVSATLSAFADALNATLSFACTQNAPGTTITEGSGFTEIAESSADDGGVGLDIQCQFKNTNDTSVEITASGSSSHLGIIGIELAEVNSSATTGAAFLYNFV